MWERAHAKGGVFQGRGRPRGMARTTNHTSHGGNRSHAHAHTTRGCSGRGSVDGAGSDAWDNSESPNGVHMRSERRGARSRREQATSAQARGFMGGARELGSWGGGRIVSRRPRRRSSRCRGAPAPRSARRPPPPTRRRGAPRSCTGRTRWCRHRPRGRPRMIPCHRRQCK